MRQCPLPHRADGRRMLKPETATAIDVAAVPQGDRAGLVLDRLFSPPEPSACGLGPRAGWTGTVASFVCLTPFEASEAFVSEVDG
jgi:hypothetical protein